MRLNILWGWCLEGFSLGQKLAAGRRHVLKIVSATFLVVCFLCLKESTCETRKNVYFISKALFILEKIKILEF